MASPNDRRRPLAGGELQMTGRHGARRGLARVWAVVSLLLALVFLGGAAAAAAPAADGGEQIQVSLERAEEAESSNPNIVLVDAILRDKAGNVPKDTYRVFSSVAPYLPDPGIDATPSRVTIRSSRRTMRSAAPD